MKEYEILSDTGACRKLVARINRMAKEGWQAKSIGGLGAPTGISAVYVLSERELTKPTECELVPEWRCLPHKPPVFLLAVGRVVGL